MFCFKPKSIIGQALAIICIVLVLGVQKPDYAKSTGDSNPVNPIRVENSASGRMSKSIFASIKIDTTSQYVGHVVEVPIFIKNDVELGSFELEVDFPYQYLTFIGAERGEALSDTSNGVYTWEWMNYHTFHYTDSLYRLTLFGLHDIPNGSQNIGVPLFPHNEYVELVRLQFIINNYGFPSGTFLPLTFEWEISDCMENTLQDPSYYYLYTSNDLTQFNSIDCPPESLGNYSVIPSLEFVDGGVQAFYDFTKTGDVNLNTLPYEVADWVCFQNFLSHGDSALINPEQQAHNSDVNCDLLPWTISDLLYLCRVILHDAVEIPCKSLEFAYPGQTLYKVDVTDELALVHTSAHPGETVSVPVWLSNSNVAGGVTINVLFDSTSLSVEGVDTSQTRIKGWQNIIPVINPGELFFFGYPDWWDHPSPWIQPGSGTLISVYFRVNASVTPGTFLPITFQTEPNLGHYNAYTDTIGLTFVQPSTISGWIYTNVISGDANSDGILDVGDLVYLINYLYKFGMPPSPVNLGDYNHDSEVNIADVVALINYLYRG